MCHTLSDDLDIWTNSSGKAHSVMRNKVFLFRINFVLLQNILHLCPHSFKTVSKIKNAACNPLNLAQNGICRFRWIGHKIPRVADFPPDVRTRIPDTHIVFLHNPNVQTICLPAFVHYFQSYSAKPYPSIDNLYMFWEIKMLNEIAAMIFDRALPSHICTPFHLIASFPVAWPLNAPRLRLARAIYGTI